MTRFLAQTSPVADSTTSVVTPSIDFLGLLPVLLLTAGAVLLLMFRSLIPPPMNLSSPMKTSSVKRLFSFETAWMFVLAVGGLVAVVVQWFRVQDEGPIAVFGSEFASDGLALFAAAVILISVAAVALLLPRFCEQAQIKKAELYVLLMLSAAGGVVMTGANDLIVMFLGLETLSIALYVMVALNRHGLMSIEAGIKYFVLGSFSSAFFLYGIAMIYSTTGTTRISGINAFFADYIVLRDGVLLTGLALLLVGLCFKVASVPFHAWLPDVYQMAPTPITAFMASAVKVAGFAALMRVIVLALGERAHNWQPAVFVLASATLLLGAILATVQNNIKRLLAYSSISHAGFMLVGVQAASHEGVAAVLFYLAVYAVISLGSFTIVSLLTGPDGDGDSATVASAAGLASRKPLLTAAFVVLLLAQAGIPLTSGFMSKFYVISAAVEARSFWLAVVAIVSAVITAFAYLRIVVSMYFTSDIPATADDGIPSDVDTVKDCHSDIPVAADTGKGDNLERPLTAAHLTTLKLGIPAGKGDPLTGAERLPIGAVVVVSVAVVVTLLVGVLPSPLVSLALDASANLLGSIP